MITGKAFPEAYAEAEEREDDNRMSQSSKLYMLIFIHSDNQVVVRRHDACIS